MKPNNRSIDLTEQKSPKNALWKNILQSHFKTVAFALLLALGSALQVQAQPICRVVLGGDEDHAQGLAKLEKRYKDIDSEIVDDSDNLTYQDYFDRYLKYVAKNGPYFGVDVINRLEFADRMTEKLVLLWKREPSPKSLAKIEASLDLIDKQSKKISHWSKIKKTEKALSLLEEASPKIDKFNVKKNEEIDAWDKAMDVVMKLAQRGSLSERGFAEIAMALQGARLQVSWTNARLINGTYISFMNTQKTPRSKPVLDPHNVFIPGTHKKKAVRYLLKWLRDNQGTDHPVIMAAKARQMVVSIHPLEDGNGRLARLVANYVLIQAGLPPASIPRGTEQQNSSVALFPLKSFQDQISPEESIQIMIDGVLRSQQHLMR